MSRYLTVGHVLVEDVMLPDGREVRNRLGGDALYAAIGARTFADDVRMAARLGRGFPNELVRELAQAGLAEGLIPSEHDTIRLWIQWGVEDGARFTFQSGNYVDATPTPDELPDLTGLDGIHIAPVPFAQLDALVGWARPRTRVLTVDPHYEHLDADWSRLLPLVDAFLPSRAEAEALLGRWPGPEEALRALGVPTAAIKLGTEGSIGIHRGEVVRLPPATTEPVDPTGCGDAFCGGFLVGLAETDDLRTALEHGTAAAGLVARNHGAVP